MNKQDQWSFSVMDKLAGELSENQVDELQLEMAEDIDKQEEFAFLAQTWEDLANLDQKLEVPHSLDHQFYEALNQSTNTNQSRIARLFHKYSSYVVVRSAAAIALLCLAVLFVLQDARPAKAQATYTSTILSMPTSTSKIKAIQSLPVTMTAEQATQELTSIIANDKNSNVRLAALYSLSKNYLPQNKSLRKFLKQQMQNETSPIVQVELLNMLIENHQSKESIRTLEQLLQNRSLNPLVQEKIQKDLPVLRASFSN